MKEPKQLDKEKLNVLRTSQKKPASLQELSLLRKIGHYALDIDASDVQAWYGLL